MRINQVVDGQECTFTTDDATDDPAGPGPETIEFDLEERNGGPWTRFRAYWSVSHDDESLYEVETVVDGMKRKRRPSVMMRIATTTTTVSVAVAVSTTSSLPSLTRTGIAPRYQSRSTSDSAVP